MAWSAEDIDVTSGAQESPVPALHKASVGTWLACMVAVVAATITFRSGAQNMVQAWEGSPEYSYGFIIPILSLFFVWQRKNELATLPFVGSWLGVLVVVAGVTLSLMGQVATVYVVQHIGLVLAVMGIVLSLTGRPLPHALYMPLLLLFFMIPMPDFLLRNVSAEMQLISSQIGVWFIRLFGISVYLEGNVIDLGVYKLQVAEACDGLRYLFPLMTLGVIMAYFFKAALWKRVLLFLLSIPITILMNSFRIGTIGLMVEHWGIGMAEGFLHEFQGWAVFMASGSVLLLGMIVLARIGADGRPWREVFGLEFPAPLPLDISRVPRSVPGSLVGACAVLVVSAVVSLLPLNRTEVIPARAPFLDFPLNFSGWSGHREALEGIYLDELKLDDYLLADFRRAAPPTVNLYVAWYDSQQAGRSAHSPRTCLPGGGWQIKEFDQIEIPGVAVDGKTLRVNRALIVLGPNRQLVYYWFQQRGRVITNEYLVKWYMFWDSLTRHRSDGALVRLTVPLAEGQDVAEADRQLIDFARETAPLLRAYIPR